jgi:4-hydroxybenzoate polyprenyltransferase
MKLRNLLTLLRPGHWLKNGLVLAALFFSFSFTWPTLWLAVRALVAFCVLASAVYVINDLADADRDRHHPTKKNRPIASGAVQPRQAKQLATLLLLIAGWLLFLAGWPVLFVGLLYLLMNLAYSAGLKHVPIVDVMIIAMGFLLRVIAGALAIHVAISHWIILCTFFLALFVAFGKRKHEMMILDEARNSHRQSMREYTDGFIDQMLSLTATTAVVFYSLYTIDVQTIERFGGDTLIYSTPIVVFGVLRYYYLLYNRGLGGDPVKLFARDRALLLASLIWLLTILGVYIYNVR